MTIRCLALGSNRANRREIKQIFSIFDETFQLTFAEDVLDAVTQLDFHGFSAVICDTSLSASSISNLNEFLLANRFPIPILLLEKRLAPWQKDDQLKTFIAATVESPIVDTNLAGKLLIALSDLFYQGRMTGLDFLAVLQLIDLDKLTCTLTLSHPDFANHGLLFFKDGNPIDAQFGKFYAQKAIERLFSLNDLEIKMYSSCPLTHDRLKTNCSKMVMDNDQYRPDSSDTDGQAETPPHQAAIAKPTGLAGLYMKVKKEN